MWLTWNFDLQPEAREPRPEQWVLARQRMPSEFCHERAARKMLRHEVLDGFVGSWRAASKFQRLRKMADTGEPRHKNTSAIGHRGIRNVTVRKRLFSADQMGNK